MHPLLSPDHERPDHRMLRVLSDGCAATGRPEESQRPDSRVPEDSQRASFEALHGNPLQDVLQRPGWLGAMTCAQCPAPKGASAFGEITVSLKRYPDTKPGLFCSVVRRGGYVRR